MNIYDVSKKAGVSIATVSRVLNGNANVSDKTKNKVLVAMKELDYTPNIFARGLGLNTMKTIGIMCSDSSDTYLANAVYYLEQELRRHNYDSILCCTGQDSETKKKYLDLLISKRVDGIILAGSQFVLNQPGSAEDRVDWYNLYGDYIYFQKNDSEHPCLGFMRTDGSGYTALFEGNFKDITITSEYVYFRDFSTDQSYCVPLGSSAAPVAFDPGIVED